MLKPTKVTTRTSEEIVADVEYRLRDYIFFTEEDRIQIFNRQLSLLADTLNESEEINGKHSS